MQILMQIWPFFNRFWSKKPNFREKTYAVFSFFNAVFSNFNRFLFGSLTFHSLIF